METSDKAVLTKYPALPSTCVICLRSSNGELDFVDFQMSLDIYGSVNICIDCVASVAKGLLNYVSAEEVEDLNAQIRNLVDMNRELAENNERLNTTMDSLLDLRPDIVERRLPSDASTDKDAEQFSLNFDSDFKL
ncbi:MAG TPA: hypothetical protein V6C65_08045 [Allocoleopsis sp.]